MRKIDNKDKKISHSICLTNEILKETQQRAKDLGITLSTYVELVLRKYKL